MPLRRAYLGSSSARTSAMREMRVISSLLQSPPSASTAQAQEAHAFVRSLLRSAVGSLADRVRIQYGGSMKADNAKELLAQPDVDGGLVGGASLKLDDFAAIIAAAA